MKVISRSDVIALWSGCGSPENTFCSGIATTIVRKQLLWNDDVSYIFTEGDNFVPCIIAGKTATQQKDGESIGRTRFFS